MKRILVGAALSLAVSLHAAEITVFAAASLAGSLKAIGSAYEKSTGDRITFSFGASSMLARQIEEGAPADIFFSADEARMNGLEKQGLIDTPTRRSRLGNALVVVVPADSPLQIRSAADLTNAAVGKIALADPKAVPAGVYAREWLTKLNLWTTVQPRVVPTQDVRAVLAAVASGNVEAGVVYKTDAGISKQVKIACEVPATEAPRISYPMALLKEAPQPEAARKFLTHLSSENAGQVFRQFGFLLLE
jgi:molybdate transport system substrate-binding protein